LRRQQLFLCIIQARYADEREPDWGYARDNLQTGHLGGASILKKEPFYMIHPIESLGEKMLFRCRACKTIIDHAVAVSRGDRLTPKPDGKGPVDRNFINIHLKCPRCNEERKYKLWLLES
jgi:hypothetical protein